MFACVAQCCVMKQSGPARDWSLRLESVRCCKVKEARGGQRRSLQTEFFALLKRRSLKIIKLEDKPISESLTAAPASRLEPRSPWTCVVLVARGERGSTCATSPCPAVRTTHRSSQNVILLIMWMNNQHITDTKNTKKWE